MFAGSAAADEIGARKSHGLRLPRYRITWLDQRVAVDDIPHLARQTREESHITGVKVLWFPLLLIVSSAEGRRDYFPSLIPPRLYLMQLVRFPPVEL